MSTESKNKISKKEKIKMTKKFQSITLDELEMVVGSAAYIYRHDTGNGKYDVVACSLKLTPQQAASINNCKSPNIIDKLRAAGINNPNVDLFVSKGLAHNNYQRYKENKVKAMGGLGEEGTF